MHKVRCLHFSFFPEVFNRLPRAQTGLKCSEALRRYQLGNCCFGATGGFPAHGGKSTCSTRVWWGGGGRPKRGQAGEFFSYLEVKKAKDLLHTRWKQGGRENESGGEEKTFSICILRPQRECVSQQSDCQTKKCHSLVRFQNT